MYMFPVILIDWAHRWRAASAAQSWSVVLTPGRDDIHCSGCEELFKEHLKIILVRGENRWIWEDIPNTNGSWVETIFVCVYTLGGEGTGVCGSFGCRGRWRGKRGEATMGKIWWHHTGCLSMYMVLYNMVRQATRWRTCNDLQWRSFRRAVTLACHLYWPVTNLAALRCTASRRWMWLVWKGSQMQLAYSSRKYKDFV